MTYISPEEQATWAGRRRRAKDTWEFGKSKLEFDRGGTQAQQGADVATLVRQFDLMRRNLPGGYARRGLLNSGIYAQALQDYGQERTSAYGDLARKYQQMLGQQEFQGRELDLNYSNAILDVDELEKMRRAQLAAQLKGLG